MTRPASFDEAAMPEMARPDLVAPNPLVGPLEPICVGKATACQLLSVSARTLDSMVDRGLPVVRLNGKNLYPIQGMRIWIGEQTNVPRKA